MKAPDLAPGVPVLGSDEARLEAALGSLGIQLRVAEVRHLAEALQRDPTAAELALVNSTWSEHCSYKSSRALLRRLPTEAPNVVLGPGSDAGIVRLPRIEPGGGKARLADAGPARRGERGVRCIAIGHESHNHPSQLLPFEGAATGVGGIVRDVYCMGAEVVGVLDALRFGDSDGAQADAVRQIARGVVAGIWHYGNALGVPNLGGEVEFDPAFDDNCLVNVVAVGILDEDELVPSQPPDEAIRRPYVLLLVGKPTDASGLGGAAFASGVLDTDEKTQQRGAVQLPDPFFKRVLSEANRAAFACLRQHGAPFAAKDLGAAGLGGASSEMAGGAGLGLELDLDAVHATRSDYAAAVLLVSETQERYVLAIPEDLADEVRAIYERDFELGEMVRRAGARVVGRFVARRRYRARQAGLVHVDLPLGLVGEPLEVHWPRSRRPAPVRQPAEGRRRLEARDLEADLCAVLGSPGGASRHWIFEHYDSDVQGRAVLRPGDGDAGVLVLRRDEALGIAVAVGSAPRLGRRDAWRAGAAAVCEAARNVAAVGATPWALTDCLNFGSPERPEEMQDLEDCVEGLAAASRALGLRGHPGAPLPFVSGNVSLYNESRTGRAIPPTPIVACLGVLCDFATARGLRLERAGSRLYWLGESSAALGCSLYAQATRQEALLDEDDLPALDLTAEAARLRALLAAFDRGLVLACHDASAGGLATVLFEMACGRDGEPRLGVRVGLPRPGAPLAARLFAEAAGFVCEVRPEDGPGFEVACRESGVEAERLGEVIEMPRLQVLEEGRLQLDADLPALGLIWRAGLRAATAGRSAP